MIFFFFLMVALCFLGCKTVSSEHFRNCFFQEFLRMNQLDPNLSVVSVHGDLCTTQVVWIGNPWPWCRLGIPVFSGNASLPPILSFSPDRGWVFQLHFQRGGIRARPWALGARFQLLLLGEPRLFLLPLVETHTPGLALCCCSASLGHQLTVYHDSSLSLGYSHLRTSFFPLQAQLCI